MARYKISQVQKAGRKVWCLDVARTESDARQRFFRSTRSEVEQIATDRFGELDQFGPELTRFTYRERLFLRQWLDQMPLAELESLVKEAAAARPLNVTVDMAAQAYLDAPRERPLSPRHTSNLKSRLKAFRAAFGERKVGGFTPGELEDYVNGKGASAPNHFRVLRGMFSFAMRREWIIRNPIKLIQKPVVPEEEKEVFTPDQMRKALRICAGLEPGVAKNRSKRAISLRHEPTLRMLILGGFCGLRHSELMRLDCSKIDLARGDVHVVDMKTQNKGVRERYVVVPENALAWLRWLGLPAAGPLIECTDRNMSSHRAQLASSLGLSGWPQNVLRRSFGSYHLAAFQNAAATAELMGHTDATTTKAKYRVPRRTESGAEWFAITPQSCGLS